MSMTRNRDRFNMLLEDWRVLETNLSGLLKRQDSVYSSLNDVFSQIITEEQLLAPLKWSFNLYHGGNSRVTCFYNIDPAAKEFFGSMEWINQFEFPPSLDVSNGEGKGTTRLDIKDGVLEFFCPDIEKMVAFCKLQGIKPCVEKIKEQRSRLHADASKLDEIIKDLS